MNRLSNHVFTILRAVIRLVCLPHPTINLSEHRVGQIWLQIKKETANPKILEIGPGQRSRTWGLTNSQYCSLKKAIISIDLKLYPKIHVQGNAHNLPFKTNTFNFVICQAVLEHVYNSERVVKEIYRVLRPNGLVYAEVPFLQPFHAAPFDYRRYTDVGLRTLFSDFEIQEVGVCGGPVSTLNWILLEFVGLVFPNHYLASMVKNSLNWILYPLRNLDKYLSRKQEARKLTSSFYIIAKKSLG